LFVINTLTKSGKLFSTPVREHLRPAKYTPPQGLNKLEECTTKPHRLAYPSELSKPKSSDKALLEISAVSAAVGWVPTEAKQAVSQISGQVVPLMRLTVTFINTTSYASSDGKGGAGEFDTVHKLQCTTSVSANKPSPQLSKPGFHSRGRQLLLPQALSL